MDIEQATTEHSIGQTIRDYLLSFAPERSMASLVEQQTDIVLDALEAAVYKVGETE